MEQSIVTGNVYGRFTVMSTIIDMIVRCVNWKAVVSVYVHWKLTASH